MSGRIPIRANTVAQGVHRWHLLHIIGVLLCAVGCRDHSIRLPEHLEVEVRGKNRRWTARYPGVDGKLQTTDDTFSAGKVCIPVGVPVTLHLRSDDYIYMFSLPHEGLDTIAVPDLEYELEFTASTSGTYKLEGGTMCGQPNTTHGTFVALAKDDFLEWRAASTK